jgi:type I restriction enzyme S subunit
MKSVPIGKVAKFVNGRAFKPSEWETEGLPIIRIQNLTGSSQVVNYFSGEYDQKHLIKKGDILISWSASLGVYRWEGKDSLLNQHIFKVVTKDHLVDKDYFYFSASSVIDDMLSQVHGTTMRHITKEPFESTEIPLPPLDEQKRIAAILSKADRLRRLRRYARELSDGYLGSVFLEMFGDPVANPMGFPIARFGEVCETRLGKMLDAKQQTGENKRPYLRNENIQWGIIDTSDVYEMDFDEREREILRLRKGDVLICEGGEVGRTAIWNDELPECYYQKALHRARPDPELTVPEFILWLMWCLAKLGGLSDFTSQVTIAHLTGVKLKAIEFPLPPLPLQEKYAQIVHKFERLRAQQQEAERQAEHLFQSLLHRAFRGDL